MYRFTLRLVSPHGLTAPTPNITVCRTSYYTRTTKTRQSWMYLWLQKFVRLRILPAWQLAWHGIISPLRRGCAPERIKWFIEDQAFSAWNDFAPPPPSHPSLPSSTGDTLEDWERETTCWQERGKVGGGGAKSYDGKKAWSLYKSFNTLFCAPSTPHPCLNFHIYWYDLHEYSSSDLN